MSEIKAITFDGDGTLWNFEGVMIEALEKVVDAIRPFTDNVTASQLSAMDLVEIRDDLAAKQAGGALDHEALRRDSIRILLERIGVTTTGLADQLADLYFEHRFGRIALYEDALPVLKRLRRHFAIALISNGNNDPGRFGLAGNFHFTIFAGDCGFSKPDTRIFDAALKGVGIEPFQAVHIGVSLYADVAGAQASGLSAIWLNRTGARNGTAILPDATVECLAEVFEIIQR